MLLALHHSSDYTGPALRVIVQAMQSAAQFRPHRYWWPCTVQVTQMLVAWHPGQLVQAMILLVALHSGQGPDPVQATQM